MPLNAKGKKIKREMESEYGPEKGEKVFYASENSGKIKDVKLARHLAVNYNHPPVALVTRANETPPRHRGQDRRHD